MPPPPLILSPLLLPAKFLVVPERLALISNETFPLSSLQEHFLCCKQNENDMFPSKSHPTLGPHLKPQGKRPGFELGEISMAVVCCSRVLSRRVPVNVTGVS